MKQRLQQYKEKLREKPIHEQKKHAFLISSAVTGAIFLLWLPVFIAGIEDASHLTNDPTRTEVAAEHKTGIDLFRDGFAAIASGARQSAAVLRGGVEDASTQRFSREASSSDIASTNEPFGPALILVTEDDTVVQDTSVLSSE